MSDAAIEYAATKITPYFASGVVHDKSHYCAVGTHVQWYFKHVSRTSDKWRRRVRSTAVRFRMAPLAAVIRKCGADSTNAFLKRCRESRKHYN